MIKSIVWQSFTSIILTAFRFVGTISAFFLSVASQVPKNALLVTACEVWFWAFFVAVCLVFAVRAVDSSITHPGRHDTVSSTLKFVISTRIRSFQWLLFFSPWTVLQGRCPVIIQCHSAYLTSHMRSNNVKYNKKSESEGLLAFSSDPSVQSSCPSHTQRVGIVMPEAHLNMCGGTVTDSSSQFSWKNTGTSEYGYKNYAFESNIWERKRAREQLQIILTSSEPSWQSFWLSQRHFFVMHCLSLTHWNCVSLHVFSV